MDARTVFHLISVIAGHVKHVKNQEEVLLANSWWLHVGKYLKSNREEWTCLNDYSAERKWCTKLELGKKFMMLTIQAKTTVRDLWRQPFLGSLQTEVGKGVYFKGPFIMAVFLLNNQWTLYSYDSFELFLYWREKNATRQQQVCLNVDQVQIWHMTLGSIKM